MPSLTEHLATVVGAELLKHERVIERDGAEARSIHVEVAIGKRGQVGEIVFWTEHRLTPSKAIGIKKGG
jgi:hypothetical protein